MALIQSIEPYQDVLSTVAIVDSKEFNLYNAETFHDECNNKFVKFDYHDLAPNEKMTIEFRYHIVVSGLCFDLGQCKGKNPKVSINAEPYIESDNQLIINLARKLEQGQITICEKSRALYDHIIANMRYAGYDPRDYGALLTLRRLSGDCVDYSDLLVAMNRAIGIPARIIDGVAGITELGYIAGENKHSWLEVRLPNTGWVPVDPTWGQQAGKHDTYFAGMTPDHIIVTRGRNLTSLTNSSGKYHYYQYSYNSERCEPSVVDEEWWDILVSDNG
jgi:hypothetical protein